jgi:hypothetical protein
MKDCMQPRIKTSEHATSLFIEIGTSQALSFITFNWIKEVDKVWPRVGGRHKALKQ